MGAGRVVEVSVVLRELKNPEDFVKQNVEVLNDVAITSLASTFVFQGNLGKKASHLYRD